MEGIRGGAIAAPEHRVDAGEEFSDGEGLNDEVVGAGIETAHALLHGRRLGDQDNGGLRPTLLESVKKLEARDTRKIEIQDNKIEGSIVWKIGDLIAGGGELHVEVFLLKARKEKLRQRGIGLSDKKAHGSSHKLTFWKGIQ